MFHTNNFTAMSRRAIALLTAAVTLSSIALIGVPAAAADEQQATAEQNTAAKPSVIINEVYAGNTKAAGDPDSKRCDWVELKNTGSTDVDVKGWGIYDSGKKAKKHYTIGTSEVTNTDTVIKAGGYLVAYIDPDKAEPGLGSDADEAYLTTTSGDFTDSDVVDSTSWNTDTTGVKKMSDSQSWSRKDDGTFALSDTPTPGAQNVFDDPTPTPPAGETMTVDAWSGLADVTTVDAEGEFGAKGQGGDHTDGNLSGLVYEAGKDGKQGVLWAADNDLNPTLGNTADKGPGSINKFVYQNGTWQQDPTDGWTFTNNGQTKGGKQLHFKDGKGGVDSEGITLINGDSSKGIFIGAERDNENKNVPRPSILQYDVTEKTTDANGDGAHDLNATHEWNLIAALTQFGVTLGHGADANLGVEGIAFIPDSVLTANGFQSNLDPKNVMTYDPDGFGNDFGGLFFAALEKTGHIYAFALQTVNDEDLVHPVADIDLPQSAVNAGYDGPRDLTWDAEHNQLLAQSDNDANTGAKIGTYEFKNGVLQLTKLTDTPDEIRTQNTEGFAITPDAEATKVVDGKVYKPVCWADDGVTNGHSLRMGYMATNQPVPASTTINLLNFNDFHGRIDKNLTVPFAATIKQLKGEYPDSSLLLSAGDNIGASLFNSSVQQDQPTIDVLNALGVKASAVGNHEFDQGYADLTDRVIGKEGARNAQWDYLGANVYKKGTTTPALPEYSIQEVNGVKVGIIGAVTQETGTLVAPGGVKGIEFGDPVEAVNRVAKQLTDGDESNGEADVIVAEYHEGAASNEDDATAKPTLDEQKAASPVFKKIVDDTDAAVNVIFTAHTHMKYSYTDPAHNNRPIIQTGSYAANIGQVVLTYNTATGAVSYDKSGNTAVQVASQPADKNDPHYNDYAEYNDGLLAAANPTVAKVRDIVYQALKVADEKGSEKVGKVSADITTAFKDGKRDDRASESTMGNLVADALLDSLKGEDRGAAEIGVVNPGGLRAEFCKSGTNDACTLDADGNITYAQANAVLPFLNNLWTTTLTGAQFKEALEQQWQTNADGSTPSRAYLQLGLSHNVSYTYDPDAAQGHHITSVTVNGEPLDLKRNYRIGSFSFLLEGGDNFRAFAQGANTKDTGLVDRDAWIDYLKDNNPVAPRYDRRAVAVTGIPTGAVKAGGSFTLHFSKLTLTSLGVPDETKLTATIGEQVVGEAQVANGDTAELKVTIPAGTKTGDISLTVTGATNKTTVALPVAVTGVSTGTDDKDNGNHSGSVNANGSTKPQQTEHTANTGASVALVVVLATLFAAGGVTIVVKRHDAARK
ncbi:5'-nucleotidase [Bifidobacterium longum subsp. longum 17-1B]|uniref:5'-nucleotidase C-terminal domain-containing protein n=1 Tax=Bifidobacterium longum TaxID=216816 RepID=UPI0004D8238D|nr:5'-nucleotidase C-terminal domain-containing protein [Bifidobacterium longum]KEY21679.1 5'-nucleotidase [Bifidobacterium longum subsp. longum 17-1B]